jgi:hypothetical protein
VRLLRLLVLLYLPFCLTRKSFLYEALAVFVKQIPLAPQRLWSVGVGIHRLQFCLGGYNRDVILIEPQKVLGVARVKGLLVAEATKI